MGFTNEQKVTAIEIADNEVMKLMRQNRIGCYVIYGGKLDEETYRVTGQLVYGAKVQIFQLTNDCKRDPNSVTIEEEGYETPDSFNAELSLSKRIAEAKTASVTKARRRGVLSFLGKDLDYTVETKVKTSPRPSP